MLAPIEDVLRLTPQTQDGVLSLESVDSDNDFIEGTTPDGAKSPLSEDEK